MEHKLVGYIAIAKYNKLEFTPTDERSQQFIQRTFNKPYKRAYLSLPDSIASRIGVKCIITVTVHRHNFVPASNVNHIGMNNADRIGASIGMNNTTHNITGNITRNTSSHEQKRIQGVHLQLTNIEDYRT